MPSTDYSELLSTILNTLHAQGSVYFCDRRKPPWHMEFNDPDAANFHLIRRGECWVNSKGKTDRLGPGDLLFVEAGRKHILSSHHPQKTGVEIKSEILLLCGYCRLETSSSHPLIKALPQMIIIRAEELQEHIGLKNILELLSSEFTSNQPGSELIVNKLTEILLVELIRINFGRTAHVSFIAALSDKQISRALELLHDHPEKKWTLEGLANKVALSRAAFANRFKQLVGQTMYDYLTQVRITLAKELLKTTKLSLFEVANRVGYDSDLAFTRVFKKYTGMTPTVYRRDSA